MTEIDKIDRKILAELQQDATLSMDSLADRVSLSRNACWRRIKALEAAGVIAGRVALLDPAKLGLGLQALVMIRSATHDADWMIRFNRALRNLPEVTAAHRMSGELDYVLRVQVADMAGYDAFYKRLIAQVPVADISASFVMESLKDSPALPL